MLFFRDGFLCILLSATIFACAPSEKTGATDTGTADEKAMGYTEPHRPQFHFSPPEKWMNDPNGMVFYDGEYHLFYQYYPDSTVWGPMHWGHAISKDMVYWEQLPIALYPDSLGYIFSGSAVVDWKNTSGFGSEENPPMIAIFTHHDPVGAEAKRLDFQYQSIAYSTDKGRSWTKYEGNPVVPNPGIKDFRDPKVSWHEAYQQWVMVFAAWDHVKFYGSPDLKNWTHLSDFGKEWGSHGGVWECPDLFPLKVQDTNLSKWVLLLSINPGAYNGGSGTQYFVGDFDGKTFQLDPHFGLGVKDEQGVWLDYGRDNYAGVTWSDIPEVDGRRLFLGWMSNWDYAQVVPTKTWRSAMTLPRELVLASSVEGLRVLSKPVEELKKLRTASYQMEAQQVDQQLDIEVNKMLLEIELEVNLEASKAKEFGIAISNTKGEVYKVGYSIADQHFFSDRTKSGRTDFSTAFAEKRHTAPRIATNNLLSIHLYLDVASAECFGDGGATVLTDIFFPSEPFDQVYLFTEEGKIAIERLNVYELQDIW